MQMTVKAASFLYAGVYSEEQVVSLAEKLRNELGANAALGFVFVTSDWQPHLEDTLELIRLHAHVPRLVGCSGSAVIGFETELEGQSGLSVMLLVLPEDSFDVFSISEEDIDSNAPESWHELTNIRPEASRGWIMLANPALHDLEEWLGSWNSAYPEVPIVGGLAAGKQSEYFLFRDGELTTASILLVGLKSPLQLRALISQGCRPIGDPSPITKAEDNFILEIGNVSAYQTLESAFMTIPADERNAVRNNLFLGLAASEYIDEFKRGDFLIRNILGADPQMGALAVAAYPRVGQTVQFQVRDPKSAHQDMLDACRSTAANIRESLGILMFVCNGRGRSLFGVSNHDAGIVAQAFGACPTAGLFCNGEIGPVGNRSFLHGYSAAGAILTAD
jgi:small ligand-binding sensory domain FIST